MVNIENTKYYSITESARILGINTSSIYYYIRQGQLKATAFGDTTYIAETNLKAFIDSRKEGGRGNGK